MLSRFAMNWKTGMALLTIAMGTALGQTEGGSDTTDFMISDFEYVWNQTSLGGYWFDWNDGGTISAEDSTLYGNSIITSKDSTGAMFTDTLTGLPLPMSFGVGRTGDSTTFSKHMSFAMGNRRLSCGDSCSYSPYVGWGFSFTTYFEWADRQFALDMSGAKSFSFWAKSDTDTVTIGVTFGTLDTINVDAAPDYSTTVDIGPEWKKYTISLGSDTPLRQPSWATYKELDLTLAKGISFSATLDDNVKHPVNGLYIDDITIDGWNYNLLPVALHQSLAPKTQSIRLQKQFLGRQMRFIRQNGSRIQVLDAIGRSSVLR